MSSRDLACRGELTVSMEVLCEGDCELVTGVLETPRLRLGDASSSDEIRITSSRNLDSWI